MLVALVLSSCTTFKLSGAQIVKDIPSYTKVGDFEINVPVMEFLGTSGGANLGNITSDAMDTKIYDAIQREIEKYAGDAAVNVTIEYKSTFVNMIVNGLTGSILAPATAYVTGVVVKYN